MGCLSGPTPKTPKPWATIPNSCLLFLKSMPQTRYMGVDELVWDDYQYPDAHMLVQMGVNGNRNAWRMSELLAESEYQTALAGFADGEDFLNRRMQVIPGPRP